MHLVKSFLFLIAIAVVQSQAQDLGTVWSLGVADNSSAEFIPYANKEFKPNSQLTKLPGYDAEKHKYDYTLIDNLLVARPDFPAGISCPGSGNDTYVTTESITWNEPVGGERIFEIKIIDSRAFNFQHGKAAVNDNMDIDGTDVPKYGLRVELPGNQVAYQYLPYDLESYIKSNGPVVMRVGFKAMAGKNTLTIRETSGQTYGRCYHFDFIRVVKPTSRLVNKPVLELLPENGFSYASVYNPYSVSGTSILAKAFNLSPEKTYTLRVHFVDFFDKELSTTTKNLRPNSEGALTVSVPCPVNVTGHIRAIGSLTLDGQSLQLQMGQPAITLFLAALRTIAEPSDDEIEKSFIGISGIPTGQALFDPYLFNLKPEIERYRKFRQALQIHNERILPLPWNFLEKEAGNFRWEFWDSLLEGEKKDRIRVQLTFFGTPQRFAEKYWKDRAENIWQWTHSCPPEMDQWATACAAVASRYKDKVADIELWNEPSEQSIYWYKASADDYFNLVKSGSLAIRKVAPEINIVAQSVWARQEDFWQRLYQLGISKYIDYPADHYMTDERIIRVNRFLDTHGRGKGLICNEAKCDLGRQIDESKRRDAARNLMRNLIHMNASGVSRIYNFIITGNTWRAFGLIGPDGMPKYTFPVMKTLVNRTTGAEFYRKFNFDNSIEAYSYRYKNPQRIKENGGDNILFLFNKRRNSHVSLYVGKAQVTLVDMMDNATVAKTQNGLLQLDLDQDPLMVVGADLQSLDLQSAVSLKNLTYDALPGERLNFSATLSKSNSSVKSAVVRLHFNKVSSDSQLEAKLLPGESQSLSIQSRNDLPEATYTIDSIIELYSASGIVNIPGRFDLVLTRKRPGVNLFSANTFSANSKEWRSWGDAKLEFPTNELNGSSASKFTTVGTGGVVNTTPLTLVEGQTYHISAKVRGQGILRLMLVKKFSDGHTEKEHNFLTSNLNENWKDFSQEFTVPAGMQTLDMYFYQYNATGWTEISDFFFTRLPQGVPLNRILFSALAHESTVLKVDSKLEDWPKEWRSPISLSGIRMNDFQGDSDLSASYACAWRGQTMLFLILVKDNIHTEIENESTPWEYDGIQMDFEPTNSNERSESCKFSFGTVSGRPTSYRLKTLPTEDIVPSYKMGPNPAGVQVLITREANLTAYRIAIPATAISPTFHIASGDRIGFSLLINDNDGKGRKGWLQWSGGIGDTWDSTLYGTLEFE